MLIALHVKHTQHPALHNEREGDFAGSFGKQAQLSIAEILRNVVCQRSLGFLSGPADHAQTNPDQWHISIKRLAGAGRHSQMATFPHENADAVVAESLLSQRDNLIEQVWKRLNGGHLGSDIAYQL